MIHAGPRPIERPDPAGPMGHVVDLDPEAARARLLAAVGAAQGALLAAVDAAVVYDALRPAEAIEATGPTDPGALLAHVVVRVLTARYGPGHHLVGHLRYWRGQRFLDEPGGPLAGADRPP